MNDAPAFRFVLPDASDCLVELVPGEPLTIGRSNDNDVQLDDDTVSRQHARLTWTADRTCRLENLRASNGTTLNGAPLVQPETLEDGDRLTFGAITAVFSVAETEANRLPPLRPASGETFAARYRLENSLGETTEYHNFRAVDLLAPGQPVPVSLKIFRAGMIVQAGGSGRILHTCALIRNAPGHPQRIKLLDCGRWRGVVYLAAEWIEGHPLVDLLRRRGVLTVPETVQLARQAAAATDHARLHGLPMPDLAPRAALVAFDAPIATAEWETLRDAPLERWPAFALKLGLRLTGPSATVPPPAVSPLIGLVYELLGHPAAALGAPRPTRVASVGERGNAVLARAQAPDGPAFESDAAFIDALARATGVLAAGEPTRAAGISAEPPAELLARTDQLAEHVHHLWLARRERDGWRYGSERNDLTKEHPRMVSYAELAESEKQRGRDLAAGTLRAVLEMGYRLVPVLPTTANPSQSATRNDEPGKPKGRQGPSI